MEHKTSKQSRLQISCNSHISKSKGRRRGRGLRQVVSRAASKATTKVVARSTSVGVAQHPRRHQVPLQRSVTELIKTTMPKQAATVGLSWLDPPPAAAQRKTKHQRTRSAVNSNFRTPSHQEVTVGARSTIRAANKNNSCRSVRRKTCSRARTRSPSEAKKFLSPNLETTAAITLC